MKVSFYRNSYSDDTYRASVEVFNKLPEIGEVIYDKFGQTETVKSFEEVEPVNDYDQEKFTFYRLTVEFKDSDEDEPEDYDQHIAVKKEEA